VEGHHDAVPGDVRVGLEIAIPERDGRTERRERVLGRFLRATPVCDGDRRRLVEIGVKAMPSRAHAKSMRRSRPSPRAGGSGTARSGGRVGARWVSPPIATESRARRAPAEEKIVAPGRICPHCASEERAAPTRRASVRVLAGVREADGRIIDSYQPYQASTRRRVIGLPCCAGSRTRTSIA
jgi:hypothetical protein